MHTSVVIVGKHLRTFQEYIKTFLIEDLDFKTSDCKIAICDEIYGALKSENNAV